eukprot:7387779-Prymnesium_polylepis.1
MQAQLAIDSGRAGAARVEVLALPLHHGGVRAEVRLRLRWVRRDLALARRLLLAAVLDIHRVDVECALAVLRAGCNTDI